MHFHRPSLIVCALLGLHAVAGALTAVVPQNPIEILDRAPWTRTWPSAVPATALRGAVSGDFTGDRTPDVWQHADTHLVMFMNSSYMDHQLTYELEANSIACYPAVGSQTKDRLLVSDAFGLWLLEFTLGATPELAVTEFVAPSAWQQARSISVYDLDNDSDLDVMGISVVGNKLLRLYQNSDGSFSAQPDINLPPNSSEAFALAWEDPSIEPTPMPQYAVLSPTHLAVIQHTGIRSRLISTPTAFGHIARVTQAPVGNDPVADCIAWLRHVSNQGTAKQVSIIESAAGEQTPLALQQIDASAIFTGDRDADGSDDLGVITKNTMLLYTYVNWRDAAASASVRFTTANEHALQLAETTTAGPDNTSTPLLADFNFDGKADFFTADRNSTTLEALSVFTDPDPIPDPPGPGMSLVQNPSTHVAFHSADYYTSQYLDEGTPSYSELGTLMLHVKDPWGLSGTPGWFMDLVVFRQEAGNVPVNADAEQHYEYDMASSLYYNSAEDVWSFPIRVDVDETYVPPYETDSFEFNQKYYILLRPILHNSDTTGTEYVIGFTSDWDGNGPMGYLTTRPGGWPVSIPTGQNHHRCSICFHCPGLPGNFEVGGAVPLLAMPRYSGTPNRQPVPTPASGPPPPAGN